MKNILFLILVSFPLLSQSQEMQSLVGVGNNKNHISRELASLIKEKDAFSLNAQILEAEQGVKNFMATEKILFNNMLLFPEFSENFTRSVLKYSKDLTALAHFGFRATGNIAGGFGPPLPGVPPSEIFIQSPQQLKESLTTLKATIHFQFLSEKDKSSWDILPFEFQVSLVKFLMACEKSESIMNSFYTPLTSLLQNGESSTEEIYNYLVAPWKNRLLEKTEVIKAMQDLDWAKLTFAVRILNENLRSLHRYQEKIEHSFRKVEIDTKYGLIGIFGTQKDTIRKNYFASIDFGGDDLYTNNCGSNLPLKSQFGLLIDYSGDDIYDSDFINAGILGLSWLIDLTGNDEYRNTAPGLAFSLFGAAFLLDMSGDDIYTSSAFFSQGSAIAGLSVLADQQGEDHYFCQNYSQGYGGTKGCGILIDVSGNDVYKGATPDEKDQKRFASFIQGAARGRWAEATDGESLAGGFGVLADGEGTDSYFARSFSQGAGYYFGIGIFSDFSGNDKYNATSHSQGYGAHFALGNFCDFKGDDAYNLSSLTSEITQILGGGRDNSCGLFADIDGNDSYYFGNRSIGIGDMRGLGCFFDPVGENTFYHFTNSLNQNVPSIGKAVALNNPANEFRLFSNHINWNAGIFISSTGDNKYYTGGDATTPALNMKSKKRIEKNQKELEIVVIRD